MKRLTRTKFLQIIPSSSESLSELEGKSFILQIYLRGRVQPSITMSNLFRVKKLLGDKSCNHKFKNEIVVARIGSPANPGGCSLPLNLKPFAVEHPLPITKNIPSPRDEKTIVDSIKGTTRRIPNRNKRTKRCLRIIIGSFD